MIPPPIVCYHAYACMNIEMCLRNRRCFITPPLGTPPRVLMQTSTVQFEMCNMLVDDDPPPKVE